MEGTMIPYDNKFDPPAPVVEVTLSNVRNRRLRVTLPAILDTVADITAIPESVVDRLKLYQISRINVEGVDGVSNYLKIYQVRLKAATLTLPQLQVIPVSFEFVVLGRDILNHFIVHLDGPGLVFTMGQ